MKFRRQFGIGSYIADFYCPEKNLAIEVDGNSHEYADTRLYDAQRDAFFEGLGIRVMRISNERVLGNIEKVLEDIIFRLGE